MKRSWLLLLVLGLAACGPSAHVTTQTGTLKAGSHMLVRVASGQIDAYKPLVGQPPDTYTLATSTETKLPIRTAIERRGSTLVAALGPDAPQSELLVRVPNGVSIDAASADGAVNVTDVTGDVKARADNGNVKVMVEGYVQASAGIGDVTVYMGSTDWPGTLHFSSDKGDVEVWINATANFHVNMHTDDGTIFTDFPLRGTASGTSETIVGNVGDKNAHTVDIQVRDGSIRLLQLKPQI